MQYRQQFQDPVQLLYQQYSKTVCLWVNFPEHLNQCVEPRHQSCLDSITSLEDPSLGSTISIGSIPFGNFTVFLLLGSVIIHLHIFLVDWRVVLYDGNRSIVG